MKVLIDIEDKYPLAVVFISIRMTNIVQNIALE